MKKSMMVMVAVLATISFAQTETVVKIPGIQKIDMESLLDVPVGSTLLAPGFKRTSQQEDIIQVGVPLEWSLGAKCRALRVSQRPDPMKNVERELATGDEWSLSLNFWR